MPSTQKQTKLISGSQSFELAPKYWKGLGMGNSQLSKFHWKKKQNKYLKKPVCLMLPSMTINYFSVMVFSGY